MAEHPAGLGRRVTFRGNGGGQQVHHLVELGLADVDIGVQAGELRLIPDRRNGTERPAEAAQASPALR
jgi:hypothetical protein